MRYIARTPIKYLEDGAVRSIAPGRPVPDELVDDGLLECGAVEEVEALAKRLGFEPDDDRPDKPLGRMTRAELDEVIAAEVVDVGGAKTNAEIVKAIEAARAERDKG